MRWQGRGMSFEKNSETSVLKTPILSFLLKIGVPIISKNLVASVCREEIHNS